MMIRKFILFPFITLLAVACGSSDNTQTVTEDNVEAIVDDKIEIESSLLEKQVDKNLDYVIENLRSSDEIIKSVALYHELFNQDLLNSPDNEKMYISSQSRAANLGVYGAELNYIIHHNQTKTSFKYLIVAKKIADQLGVALAFDQKVLDEYKSNTEHKDTLVNLVNSAYSNVKKLLKSSDQFQLASLVIAGSWTENVYLVSESISNVPDQDMKTALIAQVWEQKEYLDTLIKLLDAFVENQYVADFVAKLKPLKMMFEQEANEENLSIIKDQLIEIRNGVIQNN